MINELIMFFFKIFFIQNKEMTELNYTIKNLQTKITLLILMND